MAVFHLLLSAAFYWCGTLAFTLVVKNADIASQEPEAPTALDIKVVADSERLLPHDVQVPGLGMWDIPKSQEQCPSMFVMIMSRRDALEKRAITRAGWRTWHNWQNVRARFGICNIPGEKEDQALSQSLEAEHAEHGDTVKLDCNEGYLNGLLTRKLIKAMEFFVEKQSDYTLFMKVDDDTFVSPSRLCDFLSTRPGRKVDFKYSYTGIFAEKGETFGVHAPICRDPDSDWYEPESNYAAEKYPVSAKGGPGYILSRTMIDLILREKIAVGHVLNNEDKAVGVWVDELQQRGWPINYVNLPGTDGYLRYHDHIKVVGRWSYYPYTVHHNLGPKEIHCMQKLDRAGELDGDKRIDQCFSAARKAASAEKEEAARLLYEHFQLSLRGTPVTALLSTGFNGLERESNQNDEESHEDSQEKAKQFYNYDEQAMACASSEPEAYDVSDQAPENYDASD